MIAYFMLSKYAIAYVGLRLGAGVGAVPDDAFQEGVVHRFADLFLGEVLQGEVRFAEGEGRAVVRVAVTEDVLPGGAEGEDLGVEAGELLRGVFHAAGLRFVVVELRVRVIYDELFEGADLHAVVDVVEGDGELLGEAADRIEEAALREEAGCGDAGVVLDALRAVHVAEIRVVGAHEGGTGDTAHAHDDAGVLDILVRVQEACAADADVLALYVADHLIDGIRVDLLDVVVEEQQVLAVRKPNAVVVDRRIVERSIPLHDLHDRLRKNRCRCAVISRCLHRVAEVCRKLFREAVLQLLVVLPGLRLIRVVLDDDKLEVFILAGGERGDRLIEVGRVVLVRDHDGDQRLLIFVNRVVEAVGDALLDLLDREADALTVVVHGAGTGFEGIKLRFRVLRGGRLVCAPVVEHHRDMDDVAAREAALTEQFLIERIEAPEFRGARRHRLHGVGLLRIGTCLKHVCIDRRHMYGCDAFTLHRLGLLGGAEDEVVVLGPVVGAALVDLPAVGVGLGDGVEEAAAGDEEVADVVHGAEQVRVEVGFKVRLEVVDVLEIDLILVGIEDLDVRVGIDRADALIEGLRFELVVMVGEDDEVTGRHADRGVGVLRDAEVLREGLIAEAAVCSGVLGENLLRCPALRRVVLDLRIRGRVHEADLEVRVGLHTDGVEHAAKELLRGCIDRDHDGEARLNREISGTLPLLRELLVGDADLLIPLVVVVVVLEVLDLVDGLLKEGAEAVLLEVLPGHLDGLPLEQGEELLAFPVGDGVELLEDVVGELHALRLAVSLQHEDAGLALCVRGVDVEAEVTVECPVGLHVVAEKGGDHLIAAYRGHGRARDRVACLIHDRELHFFFWI